MAEVDEEVKAEIELAYAVDESDEGDSDLVVEIKGLYKDLALALVDKLPEGRNRFLALADLNNSKGWAVESTDIVPGVEPTPPPDPEVEVKQTSHKK